MTTSKIAKDKAQIYENRVLRRKVRACEERKGDLVHAQSLLMLKSKGMKLQSCRSYDFTMTHQHSQILSKKKKKKRTDLKDQSTDENKRKTQFVC